MLFPLIITDDVYSLTCMLGDNEVILNYDVILNFAAEKLIDTGMHVGYSEYNRLKIRINTPGASI